MHHTVEPKQYCFLMLFHKIKEYCTFHSSSHQVLLQYPCGWVTGRLLWQPGPVSATSDEHKQEAHPCQHSRLRFKTALTLAKNRNVYPCTSTRLCSKEASFASKEFPIAVILPKAATAGVSLHHLLSICCQFSLCFVHFALAAFNWMLPVLPKCLRSQLFSPGIHETFHKAKFCY